MLRKAFQNRYNAAAWSLPAAEGSADEGNIVLLLREVTVAGAEGEPDKGAFVRLEIDPHGHLMSETVVWRPETGEIHLEDARALPLPGGRVLIGLTAVLQEGKQFIPYPAVATLSSPTWDSQFPPVDVIKQFGPGKNMTPVDAGTFIFRPEGAVWNHKLLTVHWGSDRRERVGEITFPTNIPWASWRIGTTMPPRWITPAEALLIIHGISIIEDKYVYSIGRAKLTREAQKFSVVVDPEPLVTPQQFRAEDDDPLVAELHEKRRVVYACGGVEKRVDGRQVLALYVNVGDRRTVELLLEMNELLRSW